MKFLPPYLVNPALFFILNRFRNALQRLFGNVAAQHNGAALLNIHVCIVSQRKKITHTRKMSRT